MKYDKIQAELLKIAYKLDGIKTDFNYKVEDDAIIIVHNYYAVVIPKLLWFLDTDKVFRNKLPLSIDMRKFTDELDFITDTRTTVTDLSAKPLHVLINKRGENIYINENYFKIFTNDKYDFLIFKGGSPKNPVAIFNQNEQLLGIIMPVNYGGEKND